MATNLHRTCDRCGRAATLSAEGRIGETLFRADLCESGCRAHMTQAWVRAGMTATKATVGHSLRGAYVADSGATFTAKEARAWLLDVGIAVGPVGKLTHEHLGLYSASH